MRVAVLVLSLFLMVVILFQSCAAGSAIGKDAAETAQFSQGGAIGFVVAFLFLVGGAFAIGVPLVSFVVFLIAGVLTFGAARTTAFAVGAINKDLEGWSWVSVVLAALSFWDWRGKRRMQTPILQPVAVSEGFCAGCGTKFAAGAKFCAKCGAAV